MSIGHSQKEASPKVRPWVVWLFSGGDRFRQRDSIGSGAWVFDTTLKDQNLSANKTARGVVSPFQFAFV